MTVQPSPDPILSALGGRIEPVRTSFAYRLAAAVVAVVLVLLPLVYLGLIALVAWAVWLHAVHDVGMLRYGRGRGKIFVVLAYVAPMAIGGILVLFLLKPLLARRRDDAPARTLTPDKEPFLFAFVGRLCAAVGAPMPRRISIDCQVNASASFRRGWLSLLGRDLTLTIGMPLVAGLDLRQLAGVLAHEFGHFSQGTGMRLTYVVRSISHWFTRVVYERDHWDWKLVHWAETSDLRVGWILHLARLFVWLSRRVLWVLMVIGQGVSGFLLRQMEFDADRHEARLAGSDAFEATARRLPLLDMASQKAHAELASLYREKRLVDNFPRLVATTAEGFPPEALQAVDRIVRESKTGWFDTHPCLAARIESAHRESSSGRFAAPGPATLLFRDFDDEARRVTWEYYRVMLGRELRFEDLVPIESLLATQSDRKASYEALQRFFQGTFSPTRSVPLFPLEPQAPRDAASLTLHLETARREVVAGAKAYTALLAGPSREAEDRLSVFEVAAGRRLRAALELRAGTEEAAEAARLLDLHDRLGAAETTVRLRDLVEELGRLLQGLEANRRNEAHMNRLATSAQRLAKELASVREPLANVPYPFPGARPGLAVADYLLEQVPDWREIGALLQAGGSTLEELVDLRARLLGRLCRIAEAAEASVGLPPLPPP